MFVRDVFFRRVIEGRLLFEGSGAVWLEDWVGNDDWEGDEEDDTEGDLPSTSSSRRLFMLG